MEEIYKETFRFAKISVFKNYSSLNNRVEIHESDPHDLLDPFSAVKVNDPFDDLPSFTESSLLPAKMPSTKKHVVSMNIDGDRQSSLQNLNLYEKSSRNYFYTNNPTDSFVNHAKKGQPLVLVDTIKLVNIKPRRKHDEWSPEFYETTKERHIKNHYYAPFSEIQVYFTDRWIRRDGNVIKAKIFRQEKSRNVGSKYFRKVTSSVTITFDMEKGNFLIVTYEGHKKVKRKHFYKNSFNSLENALPNLISVKEYGLSKASKVFDEYMSSFNNEMFTNKLLGVLNLSRIPLSQKSNETAKNIVNLWMFKFVELKEIKMPDSGIHLLRHLYPTEKYLKRNERKLIASILDRHGMLSKFTVKILHQNPALDMKSLYDLHIIFGRDAAKYLGNIDMKFFGTYQRDIFDSPPNYRILHYDLELPDDFYDIQDFEKENIVHIINDSIEKRSAPMGLIREIIDHFRMMEKLRPFYPGLQLNVRKISTFTAEHSRLSGLERDIKKGYSIKVLFDDEIINEIEKEIEIITSDGMFKANDFEQLSHFVPIRKVYTPVLLQTSEAYTEEGAIMHHCVAGYVEHSRSIIVSLRYMDERVTCEFDTRTKHCIQARYYQNQKPPEHFVKPLEILKERIKRIPFSIEPRQKVRIPLKINGVEVKLLPEETLF